MTAQGRRSDLLLDDAVTWTSIDHLLKYRKVNLAGQFTGDPSALVFSASVVRMDHKAKDTVSIHMA